MQQKIYDFLDNLIWIGNGKFSLLLREYSQLAVNELIYILSRASQIILEVADFEIWKWSAKSSVAESRRRISIKHNMTCLKAEKLSYMV